MDFGTHEDDDEGDKAHFGEDHEQFRNQPTGFSADERYIDKLME